MRRRTLPAFLAVVIAVALPASAGAWAPAATAPIHPGVMTFTQGAQCTANFIYTQGADVYIGQAAHCASTDSATSTNGCQATFLPIGTAVEVDGASRPGTLVYSSWNAMKAAGEADGNTCAYNDLALIRLDPLDVPNVNPSVPSWGGPTGVGAAAAGQRIYTYGNSSLRGGVTTLSPKTGTVIQRTAGGWHYDVYTATPGIPGDSGSGFLNQSGQALGVLSTVAIAPFAGSNGVGDLGLELGYARAHGFSSVALAPGTQPFNPGAV
jgi:hypothetical protein